MFRRFACALALAGAVAVAAPSVALAETNYPAPVVSSTQYPAPPVTSSSIKVLDTNKSIAPSTSSAAVAPTSVPSAPSSGGLAYTGVSSDLMLIATIAAIVVLLGVALVVVGARRALRRRPRHS